MHDWDTPWLPICYSNSPALRFSHQSRLFERGWARCRRCAVLQQPAVPVPAAIPSLPPAIPLPLPYLQDLPVPRGGCEQAALLPHRGCGHGRADLVDGPAGGPVCSGPHDPAHRQQPGGRRWMDGWACRWLAGWLAEGAGGQAGGRNLISLALTAAPAPAPALFQLTFCPNPLRRSSPRAPTAWTTASPTRCAMMRAWSTSTGSTTSPTLSR